MSNPVIPGNLPEHVRFRAVNPDGSVSTVRTLSVGNGKREVLIPTVIKGKVRSNKEAVSHYKATGENFGEFDSVKAADSYANDLHKRHQGQLQQEARDRKMQMMTPQIIPYDSGSGPTFGGAGSSHQGSQQASGPVTGKMGLLDSVLFALTGTPDSMLDKESQKARNKRRKNAGDMAAGAASDPESMAEGYMGPQSGGAGGFKLGNIIKAIGAMV